MRLFLSFLVFASIGLGISVALILNELKKPIPLQQVTTVEVKHGETLSVLAGRFDREGIIANRDLFYWFGRIKQLDRRIVAGEYLIEPGVTVADFYSTLLSGKTVKYAITLIEGWTLKDIFGEFENHTKLRRSINIDELSSKFEEIYRQFPNAEGWFFPDTYYYQKNSTDLDILQRALKRMQNVLEDEWEKRAPGLPVKSPHEALTLASIVEKETGATHERRRIAGVFISRLRRGMRLQTDPTVIYGLGDSYSGNLTRKHLKTPTLYNTYVIKGLPPTPIALPGKDAIHAVLHPDVTGELYFVAKGDGTHAFSKTLLQHKKAVRQYQLKRRTDYRSTQK